MSIPEFAIGSKSLRGGKTWIDINGMPACVEKHPDFSHYTCIRCFNACITFTLTEDGPICSACDIRNMLAIDESE